MIIHYTLHPLPSNYTYQDQSWLDHSHRNLTTIVLEHAIRILHFLKLLESAIWLLERISSHHFQVLLKKTIIFISLSLSLGPFDFKSENSGVLCQNVSTKIWKWNIFRWFCLTFLILISDIISTTEKLLLLVWDRNDYSCRT